MNHIKIVYLLRVHQLLPYAKGREIIPLSGFPRPLQRDFTAGCPSLCHTLLGRCKKYSDQTDQTDQTGQMTKDIFGDSQVGSLAWELVYF